MTIDDFLKIGIVEERESSNAEISELLKIVERDVEDSSINDVSLDWQFGIAYNAALKLATIVVRASGYRVKSGSHHKNTIALIPILLGKEWTDDSNYLNTCRRKRNTVEYDCVGGATENDVMELRKFVIEFKEVVLGWLSKNTNFNY